MPGPSPWPWVLLALVAFALVLAIPTVPLHGLVLRPGPAQPAHTSVSTPAGAVFRSLPFWLLSGGFAICGMTTNGLIATHFVPAAHDHGMPATTAASLLAVVGIFDVVGTIASGWLTDKVDPRLLLVGYYVLRGVGLMTLPALMSPHVEPTMWVFIIVYGLDWVATVPPTVALCREHFGAATGPIVWTPEVVQVLPRLVQWPAVST